MTELKETIYKKYLEKKSYNGLELNDENDLLSLAFAFGDKVLSDTLFSNGVKPIMSKYDEPLSIACTKGALDFVISAVKNGADINARRGHAILSAAQSLAPAYSVLRIMEYLINNGADIKVFGNVLLNIVCQWQNSEVVKLLLDNGLDKSIGNDDLVYAAKRNIKCPNDIPNILKLIALD